MTLDNELQSTNTVTQLAAFFRVLSQPTRVEILLAIGSGEACVCHLEAVLEQRQAYISQHLMALRDADLLTTRREGRFIFYRLADDRLLPLIRSAAGILGIDAQGGQTMPAPAKAACGCPHCTLESGATMLSTSEAWTG